MPIPTLTLVLRDPDLGVEAVLSDSNGGRVPKVTKTATDPPTVQLSANDLEWAEYEGDFGHTILIDSSHPGFQAEQAMDRYRAVIRCGNCAASIPANTKQCDHCQAYLAP